MFPSLQRICSTVLLATSVLLPRAALADNGAIGYANPIPKIQIDGKLEDWPDARARLPIAISYGEPSDEEAVPEAFVSFAYNVGAQELYVAVEVTDEQHLPDAGDSYREGDGVIVYFGGAPDRPGSGVAGYAVTGERREITGTQGAFDPDVASANWSDVEAAFSRSGELTRYEYRFGLPEGAEPGAVISLDVAVRDVDDAKSPGTSSMRYWGPYFNKPGLSGRSGDVVLVDESAGLGKVVGRTMWQDDLEPMIGAPVVQLASLDDPRRWIQASGDDDGRFEVDVPPGRYVLSYPYPVWGGLLGPHERVADSSRTEIEVEANEVTEAELVLTRGTTPDLYPEKGVLFDFDVAQSDDLDAFVEAWMDYFFVPGASLALVKDGEIVYSKTYGVRNAYTGEPVEENTVFEAASITKIVFAFAVNRLAERGVIDLDRPLHEYLAFEELEGDPRYRQMTARHVLTHRTGLPNWRSGNVELAFAPGEKHGYSGEAFEYLKRVAQEITGKTIEEILMDEVQIPMGFPHNTWFKANDDLRAVVAHGHSIQRPNIARIPTRTGVAHSMHTEAGALAQFMVSLLAGKGLKPESYQAMFTRVSDAPLEPSEHDVPWLSGFGLGFALFDTPYGQAFWHGGNNGDFHARFEAYPDHDMGFVVMANNERGWALGEVLRRYLIAGGDVPSSLSVASATTAE